MVASKGDLLDIKERLLLRSLESELESDRSAGVKQCCMYDIGRMLKWSQSYHYHMMISTVTVRVYAGSGRHYASSMYVNP